jgi:hypothetical protein
MRDPRSRADVRALRMPDRGTRRQQDSKMFCCVNCARAEGSTNLKDRA